MTAFYVAPYHAPYQRHYLVLFIRHAHTQAAELEFTEQRPFLEVCDLGLAK